MGEKELRDKVAVVTGGARGIGRSIVLALSRQGADCAFTYLTSPDAAEALAAEVRGMGRRALPVRLDARDYEGAKALIERVKTEFGRLDMLVNNGCGSTRAGAVRWSAYMYDLELTPYVYGGSPEGPVPDDYFAHLAVDLFYDLDTARRDFACNGPLATAVCNNLASSWLNAKDKLAKCLKDSYAPRTSEAVRNCNSFDTQMANYRATLNTVPSCTVSTTDCRDPENRLGELKARVDTLRHVVNDRLIPSVPAQGWVDKLTVLNDDGTLKQPVQ